MLKAIGIFALISTLFSILFFVHEKYHHGQFTGTRDEGGEKQ